jgi:hypothetical protein
MTTLIVTFGNCSTASKYLKHVAEYRYLKKIHTQIQAQMAKNPDVINEGSSLLKRKKLQVSLWKLISLHRIFLV